MVLCRLSARLLAISIIAGLVLAPLVTPAVAKAPVAAEMTGMSSMPADMPCCPDEQKTKDCRDCPLVAICILKTTLAGPLPAAAMPLRYGARTTYSIFDDVPADELERPPPDHPPRNLA
jgi:hypothetical protein